MALIYKGHITSYNNLNANLTATHFMKQFFGSLTYKHHLQWGKCAANIKPYSSHREPLLKLLKMSKDRKCNTGHNVNTQMLLQPELSIEE